MIKTRYLKIKAILSHQDQIFHDQGQKEYEFISRPKPDNADMSELKSPTKTRHKTIFLYKIWASIQISKSRKGLHSLSLESSSILSNDYKAEK
jgi:hypothetical protein